MYVDPSRAKNYEGEILKNIILLLLLFSMGAFSQVPPISQIQMNGKVFSFYSSSNITTYDKLIERAIITIHGSTKNGDTYYKSVSRMAKKLGVESTTFVLSPNFKESSDQRLQNELTYRPWQDWWIGENSIEGSKTSSFAVIDNIIKKFSNKKIFPNLKTIVITGHSAGGHLTQRFALGSRVEDEISGVKIKYVVANPGTYAYLNNKRPTGTRGQFIIPRNPGCYYNHYKYGLEKRNQYMSRDSKSTMITRYLKRNIVYLLGEQDLGDVEQSCEARLQGRTRFERGVQFKEHLDVYFPENLHKIVTIPGVGHTQYGMYTSELGSEVLFFD